MGVRMCAIGIWWAEARDVTKHSTMNRTAYHEKKIIWLNMSVELKLTYPALRMARRNLY